MQSINWMLLTLLFLTLSSFANSANDLCKNKGKVFPYSLPSVGPGADPGVQAVKPQVTFTSSPAVGCHYFPPGLRSPSQSKNVTVLRPVASYTAWWRRHRCKQLGKGGYAALFRWKLNPRHIDRKSNALPPRHYVSIKIGGVRFPSFSSTQPCITPGSLNRVPASAAVKGKSQVTP